MRGRSATNVSLSHVNAPSNDLINRRERMFLTDAQIKGLAVIGNDGDIVELTDKHGKSEKYRATGHGDLTELSEKRPASNSKPPTAKTLVTYLQRLELLFYRQQHEIDIQRRDIDKMYTRYIDLAGRVNALEEQPDVKS